MVLWLSCNVNAQSDRVTIQSEGLPVLNYLNIDDFYLTHHLYIDLFLRENLFPDASAAEVSQVIDAIKKFVSDKQTLEIHLKKPNNQLYQIKIGILKKDDFELLIAFTNWNSEIRSFEEDIDVEKNSYTRWYFLSGNKMTYRLDMSNEKDYSTLSNIDLANAFLFDELSENDTQIQTTLDNYLKKADIDIEDQAWGRLILLKYYIYKRDKQKIKVVMDELNKLFESNENNTKLKRYEVAFTATKFLMELMD